MDEYVRAAARVHNALLALQSVPEALCANYADEFTRELVRTNTHVRVPPGGGALKQPLMLTIHVSLVQRAHNTSPTPFTADAIYLHVFKSGYPILFSSKGVPWYRHVQFPRKGNQTCPVRRSLFVSHVVMTRQSLGQERQFNSGVRETLSRDPCIYICIF